MVQLLFAHRTENAKIYYALRFEILELNNIY